MNREEAIKKILAEKYLCVGESPHMLSDAAERIKWGYIFEADVEALASEIDRELALIEPPPENNMQKMNNANCACNPIQSKEG